MAVRIAIRPRLTLPEERTAKPRRRVRLPPLTVPALGYWLAMGALTYFFSQLGENPLERAWATPTEEPPRDVAPEPAPPAVANVALEAAPEPESPPALAAREPPEPAATADEAETLASSALVSEEPARVERARRREAATREHDERGGEPQALREAPSPRLSFPEFTDSSRPTARERAADGPRIDGLFERRPDEPATGPAAPASPPPVERDAPAVVSSCESAIARNNETIELGAPRGPTDITRESYAGILQNGSYLSGCSIPDRTVFEICAAVKHGRAVGITVSSSPPSASLNSCVRRAVSRLKFPESPKLDVTHTRFGAAR